MKLHTKTPNQSRMCPIDFWVKGQGRNAVMTEIVYVAYLISLYTYNHETLNTYTYPMSLGCTLLISGSNGQGHNALITKNGFAQNCFPFTNTCTILKLHTQASMSPGYARLIASKGKRSDSVL